MSEPTTIERLEKVPDAVREVIEGNKETLDGFSGKLDEFSQAITKLSEPSKEDEKADAEDVGELGQAKAIESVMNFKVWDIPVGQAVIGGFSAMFVSEVIDGVMGQRTLMTKGIVKLGTAGVIGQWGGQLLGTTGKRVVVLLLAFDGLRDITPLDQWARQASSAISGVLPTAGLAGPPDRPNPRPNVVREAETVAGNYYRGALGG